MVRILGAGLLAVAALSGCTSAVLAPGPAADTLPQGRAGEPQRPFHPAAGLVQYRCDQGLEFTVRFVDDSALLDSTSRGQEVLLRDAGGVTPQQSVYSNARLRAEFGLGADGREAILHYLAPASAVHCMRD